MAVATRQEFTERVVQRLMGMPVWGRLPADRLETVAGLWWDACRRALEKGHFAELEKFVRQVAEQLARREMDLEDFAQLLRVHRDAALSLGWAEEQVGTVDEAIDGMLESLHDLAPGWKVPKGYSYCGTVMLEIPVVRVEEGKKERRSKSRVKIKQKIRVRSAMPGVGLDEARDTVNVTPSGLYFESFRDYRPGMRLFVSYPYEVGPDAINRDYLGEVVRVERRSGGLKQGIAVRLLHTV